MQAINTIKTNNLPYKTETSVNSSKIEESKKTTKFEKLLTDISNKLGLSFAIYYK